MSATHPEHSHAVAAAPSEVLTLRRGAVDYGIDLLRVQEIRSSRRICAPARAPRLRRSLWVHFTA